VLKRPFCLLVLLTLLASGKVPADAPKIGTVHLAPGFVQLAEKVRLPYEEGQIFVSENRAAQSPRVIAVKFRRFPSLKGRGKAPVFFLTGGPGWTLTAQGMMEVGSATWLAKLIPAVIAERDMIFVSQRGWTGNGAPDDLQYSYLESDASAKWSAYKAAVEDWRARGMDLAGYDFPNIVEDLEDLRQALGYEKVILQGTSFGSQWSFGYLKRHQERVERALLSGIEPLNYAIDSQDWVWAGLERLAAEVQRDPKLKPHLPKGGLIKALKSVYTRLESQPVAVSIVPPGSSQEVSVTVSVADLQQAITNPSMDAETLRAGGEQWPRFVLELLQGDYRYLAARKWSAAQEPVTEDMINVAIDGGLWVDASRAAKLDADKANRFLGSQIDLFREYQKVMPTKDVGDPWRKDFVVDVPVLFVQGDMDVSTPLENALSQRRYLKNGAIVVVGGGTHSSDDELPDLIPGWRERINTFLTADWSPEQARKWLAALPRRVNLPPRQFTLPSGPSLYEQWRVVAEQ
jgi:pimeloyl-ACP methyl ester carboxylesterase